jgi:F-type H+-transporting ATPase subunit epsilon
MATFKLEIVTPKKTYPPMDIVSVDVPAEEGRLTVLAGHQPFACSLTEGQIMATSEDGRTLTLTISPGTLTVRRDGTTILVREVLV